MHLTAKFHHPTFNCSEAIVLTNKQTTLKHPPRSAMLRHWVKIPTMHAAHRVLNFIFITFVYL